MSGFCKKIFSLALVLALLAPFPPANARGPLTIEAAVQEALQANPALMAAGKEVEAAKARIHSARSLNDPMVGVEFEEVPVTTSDITQGMMTNYVLTQDLPFPTKLAAKSKAAKKNYLAEQNSYEAEKIDLMMAVEHSYHHLYLFEHSLGINRELQGVFQRLAAAEQAKYQTGGNTSQNFLKARVEAEKLKNEEALLEAERVMALAQLNRLRNKNPGEEVSLAGLPSLHPVSSHDALEEKFFKKNPEVKSAKLRAEAFKADASLAKQEAWIPDLQARFAYNQRYNQQDAWTGGAMINLPFVWGKKRKEAREAKAMAQAARHALRDVENERLARLEESYARLESARQSHAIFKEKILPQAQLALKSSEAAYQTGQDDFLSLIDAAREFKEVKLSALEAFVNYHRAVTDLKGAVGEEIL
ncbi:MAG: TolC family protein [Deltaproteobacteria bacterium]|nr:TolC family protein [Deltaproteobacteria bacterium]